MSGLWHVPKDFVFPQITLLKGSNGFRGDEGCAAVVGLMYPKGLALGAESGKSSWLSNCCATG